MLPPPSRHTIMKPSRRHKPADDELHYNDAWTSEQSAENPNVRAVSTRKKTQNAHQEMLGGRSRTARREGATMKSPKDLQVDEASGTQLEKSHKKEKTKKQRHVEQLLAPVNGSETCDSDYTLPLKDQSDRFRRHKSDERQWTSRESNVGTSERSKKGKKMEDTDHVTHRTRSKPQTTSYFELDLAYSATPISLISMDEFDWLEDLYYEKSLHREDSNDSESPFQEPDTDEAYVLSAVLDQVDQIMERNAYMPSTQIKQGRCKTTSTSARRTAPLPFASEEESDDERNNNNIKSTALSPDFEPIPKKYLCVPSTQIKQTPPMTSTVAKTALPASAGEHNSVISVEPLAHVEQITKKISCMSPQIKRTLLRTHSTRSSSKKTYNSSHGDRSSTASNAGYGCGKNQEVDIDEARNHGNGSCTDSYLESSEWKAREELRQDWMHFIADRRSRRSSLHRHRSSSVPNFIAAAPRVDPRLLGSKSTSYHEKRNDIRSSPSSSAPLSADDGLLLLKLDSWEVKQRKAVLERTIKDAKRNNKILKTTS